MLPRVKVKLLRELIGQRSTTRARYRFHEPGDELQEQQTQIRAQDLICAG